MSVEKRSPWVVLGIPFPATKAEANRAFARRSRELRKNRELPWDQEDLSWALAAVTLVEESPDATVNHYRVPADPGVFDRPAADDLFVPAVRPIERRTDPAESAVLDGLCARAAVEEIQEFLDAVQPSTAHDPYGSSANPTETKGQMR